MEGRDPMKPNQENGHVDKKGEAYPHQTQESLERAARKIADEFIKGLKSDGIESTQDAQDKVFTRVLQILQAELRESRSPIETARVRQAAVDCHLACADFVRAIDAEAESPQP